MKKYLGLASAIISLITIFIVPIDWRLGILGIIIGSVLSFKAPKGILKYVSFVILVLCILLLLYLIVIGIITAGLIDIDNNRLP